MRIKKIKFINDPILGDLSLDFSDSNGNIVDTVLLAGENGTGKSTILNAIYEFLCLKRKPDKKHAGRREFTIQFLDEELDVIKYSEETTEWLGELVGNEVTCLLDFNHTNDMNHMMIQFLTPQGEDKKIGDFFRNPKISRFFKSIYSDGETNYMPGPIKSVTSRNTDEQRAFNIKSSQNLANEITQLLVDLQVLDDGQMAKFVRMHQRVPNVGEIESKMIRFVQAFQYMFPNKNLSEVINDSDSKKVIFSENDKTVSIEDLSSGEKQIVFRASFLLQNQKVNNGSIVLLDEPENNLHPAWQIKILDFYKYLFTNELGDQTSQIFISTHSPFIIHNKNSCSDKVIVLKKNSQSIIFVENSPGFFTWGPVETVKRAFNTYVSIDSPYPHVITEGKTDWKHIKSALTKLQKEGLFTELILNFWEYENDTEMGDDQLKKMCQHYSKRPQPHKYFFIFDRDKNQFVKDMSIGNQDYKDWGNNVYSIVLPVPDHRKENPDISIEFYYSDEDIFTFDKHGRRLHVNTGFHSDSGFNKEDGLICKSPKLKKDQICILDSDIFNLENQNVALSKNNFAENILKEEPPFDRVKTDGFVKLFELLQSLSKQE